MRPSSAQVVEILEHIQEVSIACFATDLLHEVSTDMLVEWNERGFYHRIGPNMVTDAFTGEFLCERMHDLHFVSTTAESIRLGRAMMDAGALHHTKHNATFLNHNDQRYYFDDYQLNRYRALVSPEETMGRTEKADYMEPLSTISQECGCRRLGQLLDTSKSQLDSRHSTKIGGIAHKKRGSYGAESVLTVDLLCGDDLNPMDLSHDEVGAIQGVEM